MVDEIYFDPRVSVQATTEIGKGAVTKTPVPYMKNGSDRIISLISFGATSVVQSNSMQIQEIPAMSTYVDTAF